VSKITAIANWYDEYDLCKITESDVILVLGNIMPNMSARVYKYWLSKLPSKNVLVMAGDNDLDLRSDYSLPEYENVFTFSSLSYYVINDIRIQALSLYIPEDISNVTFVKECDILCVAISKALTLTNLLLNDMLTLIKCKKMIVAYPNTELFNEINADASRIKHLSRGMISFNFE